MTTPTKTENKENKEVKETKKDAFIPLAQVSCNRPVFEHKEHLCMGSDTTNRNNCETLLWDTELNLIHVKTLRGFEYQIPMTNVNFFIMK